MFFLSLKDPLLRNFFLSSDLTTKAHWISLFIKGAWFARINLHYNGTIMFKTDRQVSLKCFRFLSLICNFDSLSSFRIWSLERYWIIHSCGNLVLLVSFSQKMILVLFGSFCEIREPGFEHAKVLEASGPICYDQIDTQGISGGFVAWRFAWSL